MLLTIDNKPKRTRHDHAYKISIRNRIRNALFTKNLNHVLFNKFANFVTGYNTDKTILFVCKPSC